MLPSYIIKSIFHLKNCLAFHSREILCGTLTSNQLDKSWICCRVKAGSMRGDLQAFPRTVVLRVAWAGAQGPV